MGKVDAVVFVGFVYRIFALGKLTKLTVRRGFEDGLRRLLLALADELQPFVPVAHEREVARPKLDGAVAALVEPMEHGDRQARIETVALGDDLAILPDRVGDAVDGLFVERVGERRPGKLARGIPAGGEQRVAGAQRIGRLLGQLRIFAGEADAACLGQHFEKEPTGERRPAVAACDGDGLGLLLQRIVGIDGARLLCRGRGEPAFRRGVRG